MMFSLYFRLARARVARLMSPLAPVGSLSCCYWVQLRSDWSALNVKWIASWRAFPFHMFSKISLPDVYINKSSGLWKWCIWLVRLLCQPPTLRFIIIYPFILLWFLIGTIPVQFDLNFVQYNELTWLTYQGWYWFVWMKLFAFSHSEE